MYTGKTLVTIVKLNETRIAVGWGTPPEDKDLKTYVVLQAKGNGYNGQIYGKAIISKEFYEEIERDDQLRYDICEHILYNIHFVKHSIEFQKVLNEAERTLSKRRYDLRAPADPIFGGGGFGSGFPL